MVRPRGYATDLSFYVPYFSLQGNLVVKKTSLPPRLTKMGKQALGLDIACRDTLAS